MRVDGRVQSRGTLLCLNDSWLVTEPYVTEVASWGKLTSSKQCFAFVFTDVPAVQQLGFMLPKVSQWATMTIIYGRREASHLPLGTAAPVKTAQKQSRTNQIQIFHSSAAAVPRSRPSCQMKTGSRVQNGINGELVSQSSHVGRPIPSWESGDWSVSSGAGRHGGGNGPEWETGRLLCCC